MPSPQMRLIIRGKAVSLLCLCISELLSVNSQGSRVFTSRRYTSKSRSTLKLFHSSKMNSNNSTGSEARVNIQKALDGETIPGPTWIKASGPPRLAISRNMNTKVEEAAPGVECKQEPKKVSEDMATRRKRVKLEQKHGTKHHTLEDQTCSETVASSVKSKSSRASILPQRVLEKVANFARENPSEIGKKGRQRRKASDKGTGDHSRKINPDDGKVRGSKEYQAPESEDLVKDLPFPEEDEGVQKESASRKKQKKKSKKRKHEKEKQLSEEEEIPRKSRPNYFVAVQVTNSQIHERLEKVQALVTSQEPALACTIVPLATLHFTLMVMHLANEDEITKACEVLQKCSPHLEQYKEELLELKFKEVDNFRNNVVFAKVEAGENLERLKHLSETIRNCFTEADIPSTDDRGFKAHATLMKMSKGPWKLMKAIKRIQPHLYKKFSVAEFGSQTVRGVQLCSMMKPKDSNGYYQVDSQIDFVPEDFQDPKDKFDGNPIHIHIEQLERKLEWDFHKAIRD